MSTPRRKILCGFTFQTVVLALVLTFFPPAGVGMKVHGPESSPIGSEICANLNEVSQKKGEGPETKLKSLKVRQQHASKRPAAIDVVLATPFMPVAESAPQARAESFRSSSTESPTLSLVKGRSPPSA